MLFNPPLFLFPPSKLPHFRMDANDHQALHCHPMLGCRSESHVFASRPHDRITHAHVEHGQVVHDHFRRVFYSMQLHVARKEYQRTLEVRTGSNICSSRPIHDSRLLTSSSTDSAALVGVKLAR